jgi:hypothetical protein
MLVSMLFSNRNLHGPVDAAKTVAILTRGGRYLSASAYMVIGHGRTPVRPDRLAGFATVLGIPPGDLAAITGVGLSAEMLGDDPLATEMAELIWGLRRLSAAQAKHVLHEARAMLVPVPVDAPGGNGTGSITSTASGGARRALARNEGNRRAGVGR